MNRSRWLHAISLTVIFLSSCGGGGTGGGSNTTPPPSPTVTSVTITCTTSSIAVGATTTCLGTRHWSNSTTDNTVSYSSDSAATATVDSTGKVTGVAAGSANITASDSSGSGNKASLAITVTAAVPTCTVNSVAVTPATATINAGGNATFAANVSATGSSCSPAVNWSVNPASAGTITSGGVFTAATSISTSTNATITATSVQDNTKSGTATVTINPTSTAPPNITSVTLPTIYLEDITVITSGPEIIGTGFLPTDRLFLDPAGIVSLPVYVDSSHISFSLIFDSHGYNPGKITITVCHNADQTGCGTSQSIAFFGGQNYLAFANGEFYFFDQGAGLVRKYKSDGTADSTCSAGFWHSIAVDNKTSLMVIDENLYSGTGPNFSDGACDFSDTPNPQVMPTGHGTVMAVAADNGFAGMVQPSNNSAYFFDATGGTNSTPTVFTASNLGNHPATIAMGTNGAETDAAILSVDGTPSLYFVRASDAFLLGSVALPGFTPLSTIHATNTVAGGSQVLMFDSGPAAGTDVAFSAYDKLLFIVHHSTRTVTKIVSLSGVPFRIAADLADGKIIVAFAVPGAATTTFASVDVVTGTVTPLKATYSGLAVGLLVSADGKTIYAANRADLTVIPNN